jgi:hypothetical protein
MPVEQDHAPADRAADAPIPASMLSAADPELGHKQDIKSKLRRASLPGSRPVSMHSHRTGTAEGYNDGDLDDTNSEIEWGPKHPCFPHPNPHVPRDSPLYNDTRIIRVARDWMQKGDLAPTFANLYPEILDPIVEEEDFRVLIKHVNDTLIDAFDPLTFRAWVDNILGVATFWLWEDAGLSGVKRKLSALERWIENWNIEHGEKVGVKIIPLRRTGYMTVCSSSTCLRFLY